MSILDDAIRDFLSQKRLAVAGVSRKKSAAGTRIYKKLQKVGYQVFAINPNVETIHGNTCYPDLKSIPGGVDGVVIVTRPEVTDKILDQCVEAKVTRVWMHRLAKFMGDSVSEAAVRTCRENGISVIPGACPRMFVEPVDPLHRCFCAMLRLTGKLPQPILFGDRR